MGKAAKWKRKFKTEQMMARYYEARALELADERFKLRQLLDVLAISHIASDTNVCIVCKVEFPCQPAFIANYSLDELDKFKEQESSDE